MNRTATKTLLCTIGVLVTTLCVSLAAWSGSHSDAPDPERMQCNNSCMPALQPTQ